MSPIRIALLHKGAEVRFNIRSGPDRELADIADYVLSYRAKSRKVLDIARLRFTDTLACALDALDYPDCAKLPGPYLKGTVAQRRARYSPCVMMRGGARRWFTHWVLAFARTTVAVGYLYLAFAIAVAGNTVFAQATPWQPERNFERIVGTAPGGGSDSTARLIRRLLQEKKLIERPSAVFNKVGGGALANVPTWTEGFESRRFQRAQRGRPARHERGTNAVLGRCVRQAHAARRVEKNIAAHHFADTYLHNADTRKLVEAQFSELTSALRTGWCNGLIKKRNKIKYLY